MIKSYEELIFLSTFEERFKYLKLNEIVGKSTFGFDRYINQALYSSREWKLIRRDILIRDNGCDLGIFDRAIFGKVIVHHINPITIENIEDGNDCVFDYNNLISTSLETHNAIHFGDIYLLPRLPKERMKGDTCPWMM